MAENPLHEAAEAIVHELGNSMADVAIAAVYHVAIEALIHPHNAEAVAQLRAHAATVRKFGRKADGHMGQMYRDIEAVLADLGVEPMDYDREVGPGVEALEARLVASAEKHLGEHLLKHAPAQEGRPN